MPHPYTAPQFEEMFPNISDFMVNDVIPQINNGILNILIYAPVKSGKKVQVECLSVLLNSYRVIYITSLDRKDVKRQKEELDKYGIMTCVVKYDYDAAIAQIKQYNDSNIKVLIVFDECDYGAGTNQLMSKFFNRVVDDKKIVKLYYSATPEETQYSKLSTRPDFQFVPFPIPATYCGARFFLDNDLWEEPAQFLEEAEEGIIIVTGHGQHVCIEKYTAKRNIGVVRVTGSRMNARILKANVQRIEQQLNSLMPPDSREIRVRVISQTDPFDWEDEPTQVGYCQSRFSWLFFIYQTCTRGTDLNGWHNRLAFWHDARSRTKSNLNTLVQAMLRPSHYSTSYLDEDGNPQGQMIAMYVDLKVLERAAGGSIDAYLKSGGKPPIRTKIGEPINDANPDDFAMEVEEFDMLANVRAKYPRLGRGVEPNDAGFYESRSIAKDGKSVLSLDELNKVTESKTNTISGSHSNMPIGEERAQIGLFIGYSNTNDKATVKFRVKKVWRIRGHVQRESTINATKSSMY